MAWATGYGKRAYRKEGEAARRSNKRRAAISDAVNPITKPSTKKRPPCESRKFGMEYKLKDSVRCGPWMEKYRNWRKYYFWYETKQQRDTALEALNRKRDVYDYRAVER